MSNTLHLIGGNEVAGQLTTNQFFTNYFNKKDFINYFTSLTQKNRQELMILIDKLAAQQHVEITPFTSVDKAGKNYKMCEFRNLRGTVKLKVVIVPQMERLLSDYVNGIITPVFGLLEILEEAQK